MKLKSKCCKRYERKKACKDCPLMAAKRQGPKKARKKKKAKK